MATTATTTVTVPLTERDRLHKMTLKELKEYAKEHSIRGYSQKKKDELVDMILAHNAQAGAGAGGVPAGGKVNRTIPVLKALIKENGGKGYSGKNKAELEKMLEDLLAHRASA